MYTRLSKYKTKTSLQKKLVLPNHACPCLAIGKILNVLLFSIGKGSFKPMKDRNTLTSKYMYLNVSLVEKKLTYIK